MDSINVLEFKDKVNIECNVITRKKSKFITHIFEIENSKQADKYIDMINKKYSDARHNVYAYVLEDTEKYTDDGEPAGTAGKPIIECIKQKGIINILIVVTRYFGGIPLRNVRVI